MKVQMRQVYAAVGGLALGLGLTASGVFAEASGAGLLIGIGAGLMVLALVRE